MSVPIFALDCGRNRVCCYCVTTVEYVMLRFHTSKSASILWALGGDERIPELVKRVSQEVLAERMEPDMRVRVRADGQDGDKETGKAVWASFLHGTSRPSKEDGLPDMQLHTHNFLANLTESDGRY